MSGTAIQTRYKGYHFRSRLEARWAVFFDALGVPWEYEPQGFSLPSGPYLPDFYFPTWKAWGEVKPNEGAYNRRQLLELAEATHQEVIMLDGTPGLSLYKVVLPAIDAGPDSTKTSVGRVHLSLSADNDKVWIEFEPDHPAAASARFGAAVQAARSARFEHGESPVLPPPPKSQRINNVLFAEYAAYLEAIDRRIVAATTNDEKDACVDDKVALVREMREKRITQWKA